MSYELEALEKNVTWTILDLPPHVTTKINGFAKLNIGLMTLLRGIKYS